jgi:uncharacterized protein YdaU (DUF1376 family)
MNFYPFHMGDYLKSTAHLTNDEDLVYRRLLDLYYDAESPISNDTKKVARKIRMPADIVETILAEFFDKQEDGWHNERCDEEIGRFKQNSDHGKKAAQTRWKKEKAMPEQCPSNARAMPEQCDGSTNQNQNQNQNKEEDLLLESPVITDSREGSKNGDGFVSPSVDEVVVFFRNKGSTVEEAESFWEYYGARGWMMGVTRMRDWHAAARKWIKTKFNGNGHKQRNGVLADQQPITAADIPDLAKSIADDPRYA